jgi:hypothetical protein
MDDVNGLKLLAYVAGLVLLALVLGLPLGVVVAPFWAVALVVVLAIAYVAGLLWWYRGRST